MKDYIKFRHGNSCHSLAGRDGQSQDIVLSPLCAEEHTLVHEVTSVQRLWITLHWMAEKLRIFKKILEILRRNKKWYRVNRIKSIKILKMRRNFVEPKMRQFLTSHYTKTGVSNSRTEKVCSWRRNTRLNCSNNQL